MNTIDKFYLYKLPNMAFCLGKYMKKGATLCSNLLLTLNLIL